MIYCQANEFFSLSLPSACLSRTKKFNIDQDSVAIMGRWG